MKTISLWANQNPTTARALLVLLHFLMIANAVLLGTLLYLFDAAPSKGVLYPTIGLGLVVLLSYPLYAKGTPAYRASYRRRKIHDAGLAILTSLIVAMGVGGFLVDNSFYYDTPPYTPTNARQVAYNTHQTAPPVEKPKSLRKKRFKKQRQQLRKSLRLMKQKTSAPNGLHIVFKILLTLVVIAVAIGLGILVAVLACNIACNGMGVVGLAVLVVGWVAIIALGIWLIILIFRNKNKAPAAAS